LFLVHWYPSCKLIIILCIILYYSVCSTESAQVLSTATNDVYRRPSGAEVSPRPHRPRDSINFTLSSLVTIATRCGCNGDKVHRAAVVVCIGMCVGVCVCAEERRHRYTHRVMVPGRENEILWPGGINSSSSVYTGIPPDDRKSSIVYNIVYNNMCVLISIICHRNNRPKNHSVGRDYGKNKLNFSIFSRSVINPKLRVMMYIQYHRYSFFYTSLSLFIIIFF
jgi:hypothetical protein